MLNFLWRILINIANHAFASFLIGAALSLIFAFLFYIAIFNRPLSIELTDQPQYVKFDFDICGKVLNILSQRQQTAVEFNAQNLHNPFINAASTVDLPPNNQN